MKSDIEIDFDDNYVYINDGELKSRTVRYSSLFKGEDFIKYIIEDWYKMNFKKDTLEGLIFKHSLISLDNDINSSK